MSTRHSWSQSSPGLRRYNHKTERDCAKCDVVRVTRHEGDRHWVEFWKHAERIPGKRTPVCDGVKT